jgi:hypothetical protein
MVKRLLRTRDALIAASSLSLLVVLTPRVAAQDVQGTALVAVGLADARLDPWQSSPVVGTVTIGTRVTADQLRGGWYLVRLPKPDNAPAAVYGWIPAAMLAAAPPGSALQPPQAGQPADETVSGVLRDLKFQRNRLDRAIEALQTAPEATPLRARRDKLDVAIRALEDTGGEPSPTPKAAASPVAPMHPEPQRSVPQTAQPVPYAEASARAERGWIDVNLGAARSGAPASVFVFTDVIFQEPFALAAAYPRPSGGADFDIGGGVMFSKLLGVGLSVTGTGHVDRAGLGVTVPHPHFFSASTTASGTTGDLSRSEGGVNFQIMAAPWNRGSTRLRIFGGPTYFRYDADMVQDINIDQSAFSFSRVNLVEITGSNIEKITATGWGLHVGADITYFFSRIVGIGAFSRFSRGTVTADEPLSETSKKISVGGIQGGGGLRLRF